MTSLILRILSSQLRRLFRGLPLKVRDEGISDDVLIAEDEGLTFTAILRR